MCNEIKPLDVTESEYSESRESIIEQYREDFKKLYVNYRSLEGCLYTKRRKRVFHSEIEREYYNRQMLDDLIRNYMELYDKYITSKHPDLLFLKYYLTPYALSQLLGEEW